VGPYHFFSPDVSPRHRLSPIAPHEVFPVSIV